jgi:hypothetical protein
VPAAEEAGLGAAVGGGHRGSGGGGGRARGKAHVPTVEEVGLGAWVSCAKYDQEHREETLGAGV